MLNKLSMVTVLLALALSGCNGQAPSQTGTPVPTDTQIATASPVNVEASTSTGTTTALAGDASAAATLPTGTATAGTPFPTNPPDCTNSAAFVTDVTVPDNTNVAGGTTFTKTWRINNNGTCVWAPNYILVHYSDEVLGAPASVPLAITYPGQNLDISVDLIAPTSTGTHRANFVIENPNGVIMNVGDDSRLWVIINVTVAGATTPTATMTAAVAATQPATSVTPSPTGSSSGSADGTCLFSIDRTKLTQTIAAVNAYRAGKGLPAYTVSAQLAQAAQRHANDSACHKLYVHTGSDNSTPQSRVAATGYVASSVSENIQGSYPPLTGQDVVDWWINDQTDVRHNQNLLSTTFTEIGVGYSFFDNYGFYVIVFAKP